MKETLRLLGITTITFLLGDLITSVVVVGIMVMNTTNPYNLQNYVGAVMSFGTVGGILTSGFLMLAYLEKVD